jgi:hypothetical protein
MINSIPCEADWGASTDDLDENYARKVFFGCSYEHARELFAEKPIERCEDLRFMPEKAFSFYIEALADYLHELQSASIDDADAASCFVNVVDIRRSALSSGRVRQALLRLKEDQNFYRAPVEIYGDLSLRIGHLFDAKE